MKIEWENYRDVATSTEIDKFEVEHNFRFSEEHREFLTTITNGGTPVGMAPVPTQDCPGEAGDLNGVYGVNHPLGYYDLGKALEFLEPFLPTLVPFAYDQGNGQLFIDMINRPGRVVYVPWEELGDVPRTTYHVANSITEFLEKSAILATELDADVQ